MQAHNQISSDGKTALTSRKQYGLMVLGGDRLRFGPLMNLRRSCLQRMARLTDIRCQIGSRWPKIDQVTYARNIFHAYPYWNYFPEVKARNVFDGIFFDAGSSFNLPKPKGH